MSAKERKLRNQRRRQEQRLRRQDALMAQAAQLIETQNQNIDAVQRRNDTWRNLLVASAFARGLGNERPISEIVEETHPELFRLSPAT